MLDILTGKRSPYDVEEDSSSDSELVGLSDIPQTTELQERMTDIAHCINCLYRFSIAVRNPTPRDKQIKLAAIDVSYYHAFDVSHVRDKFPEASEYLWGLLGRANSKRRQWLVYHEKHHQKILNHEQDQDVKEKSCGAVTETTLSTIKDGGHGTGWRDGNPEQDLALSVTSYATSASEGSNKLRVPPPPDAEEVFEGVPFICPYCYKESIVKNQHGWM